MRNSTIKGLLLLGIFSLLYGCKEAPKKPEKMAQEQNEANMRNNTVEKEYAQLLVEVIHDQLYEVELGKVGLKKSQNAKLKDFAAVLQKHHQARLEKLQALAAELEYSIPNNLSDQQWDDLNKLENQKPNDFDRTWIKEVISKHNSSVNTLVDGIEDTTNMRIKSELNETLQEVRSHLETATQFENSLKK
ncbi:DUF4142 domain-containing protein [Flavobacterium sp. JP2137]|uniref:DUF4142 domain-containing protein n=1 Tax=Flavobacterium sp. JP2137 TaxID=3414510 RepID=UPI003D2FB685